MGAQGDCGAWEVNSCKQSTSAPGGTTLMSIRRLHPCMEDVSPRSLDPKRAIEAGQAVLHLQARASSEQTVFDPALCNPEPREPSANDPHGSAAVGWVRDT